MHCSPSRRFTVHDRRNTQDELQADPDLVNQVLEITCDEEVPTAHRYQLPEVE